MVDSLHGKSPDEWIAILQSGDVAERCTAALALADLQPRSPHVENTLRGAVKDDDLAVQIAAQIAIGFVHVPGENRRKMITLLGGGEDDIRSVILALEELAFSNFHGTASALETDTGPSPSTLPKEARPKSAPAEVPDVPDIVLVHKLPWWFLIGAAGLCLLLAWGTRSVWWSKWAMLALAGLFALFLLAMRSRHQKKKLSNHQFQARSRLAYTIIAASISGFLIGLLFAVGTVHIDNANGFDVRVLLNGQDWLTIPAGEAKTSSLTRGTYDVSVKAQDGNQILDSHPIEVSGCGHFVLNVMGAQSYFYGTLHYGSPKQPTMEMITARWFRVPQVDYLFRDPPATVNVQFRSNELPPQVSKSYITKGAPPHLKGRDQ